MATEFKFEIVKNIGVISRNLKTGWTKEVNLVSWNEGDAKYDIREWDETHTKMSKGLTFTTSEARELMHLLEADARETF